MYDPYAEFEKTTLPNGLDVYSQYMDRPWVIVGVVVHAGSREDTSGLGGLAHYVEHMVSCNIPGYEASAVEHAIKQEGGTVSFGMTAYESTQYGFSLPADIATLRRVLNMFGSMLLRGQITNKVENERRIIQQEFARTFHFREKLDWHLQARQNLFKGHRIESWSTPLGSPETINRICQPDLQWFYDTYYVPANISLVVAGGVRSDELLNELNDSVFGMNKSGSRNRIPEPFENLGNPAIQNHTICMADYLTKTVSQTEYEATWAIPKSVSNAAIRVMGSVLDKALFEEVRTQRSDAYEIGTKFASYQDVYEFMINALVHPEATTSIDALVQECIPRVLARQDLVEQERLIFIKRGLLMDLSGSNLVSSSCWSVSKHQRIQTAREMVCGFERLTHHDVLNAGMCLTPKRKYVFTAHP